MHQPSCSLDFLTFSDIEEIKKELACSLKWLSSDPPWDVLNGAQFEADLAYHLIGRNTPKPKDIIQEFVEKFLVSVPGTVEEFRKMWNYAVEAFEGKTFVVNTATGGAEFSDPAKEILAFWMTPRSFLGPSLYHFYAAVSILEDAASNLDMVQLKDCMSLLVEASRRAVTAQASLEVS
jgi:hypothetical protein